MDTDEQKSKNLLCMNRKEKEEFLDSFDLILCDLDGVISNLTEPLPGAATGINLLKSTGKQFKIVTNNSLNSEVDFVQNIKQLGIKSIHENDLIYPRKLIIKYIQENFGQKLCFSIGCPTFNRELQANGVNIKTLNVRNDLTLQDVKNVLMNSDPVSAVILDYTPQLTYAELALADHYLRSLQCPLLIGVNDSYVHLSKDIKTLASFYDILKKSTTKAPLLFGKPGALMGQYVLRKFHITEPHRVLLIGDNLETDIQFGKDIGFQTLFALSGIHSLEDMLRLNPTTQPDYYIGGVRDFTEFFRNL